MRPREHTTDITIRETTESFFLVGMTRVSDVPVNIGVFLIILGALILGSILGVTGLSTIQSLSLVVALFGVWLALAALVMPAPPTSYAATRTMFLGWGGIFTGIGALWFSAYYSFQLFAVVFASMLIVAGIGALGYSLTKGQAKKAAVVA